MRGAAVHVSGPAGAGKSTLCRAMVNAEAGWVHVEADRCLPHAHQSVYADAQLSEDLIVAFHEAIAAYTARGFVVLVDGSLPAGPETRRRKCLDALAAANQGPLLRVAVQIDRDAWSRRNPDATPEDRDWYQRQLSAAATRAEQFDLIVDAVNYDTSRVVAELKARLNR